MPSWHAAVGGPWGTAEAGVFGPGRSAALLWITLLSCLAATLAGAAPPPDAEGVYARFKDRVLQVQLTDRSSGAKAGLGSGFAVGRPGWVVTNYHVIAALVFRPERYRAEYRTATGERGGLDVLAIDVVHDLALLQAEGLALAPLQTRTQAPAQGERLYSLGNPFDLGLTIVEGTFNGHLEKSRHRRFHFTGSINPGMSGGPTVDRSGQVVGVNVATAGNQVSFLVPAERVAVLLAAPRDGGGGLLDRVREQLLDLQEQLVSSLLEVPLPTSRLGGFEVPAELAPYLNCWGDTADGDDADLGHVYQECSTSDDIYLHDELTTGEVRFRHELFEANDLSSLHLYAYLESHFENPHLGFGGSEEEVTNYRCRQGLVERDGFRARTAFCVRGYRRLPGLYDAILTANSLVAPRQALHTGLALAGFSFENALRVSRAYLESLRWIPEK